LPREQQAASLGSNFRYGARLAREEATIMADIAGSNGERKEFRIVGKQNIPGRLSYSIATGKAKFGVDVVVPNMLFAKFLRNPYGRARVKSLDISKAKRLPGVVDIVTWEDPDIKAIPQIDLPLLINEADMEDDEVGAIVVAESEELCDEALKLIKVDWEVLPGGTTIHWAQKAKPYSWKALAQTGRGIC
jgi:CO/xanthine dehydrogenase Mo-binding subunit